MTSYLDQPFFLLALLMIGGGFWLLLHNHIRNLDVLAGSKIDDIFFGISTLVILLSICGFWELHRQADIDYENATNNYRQEMHDKARTVKIRLETFFNVLHTNLQLIATLPGVIHIDQRTNIIADSDSDIIKHIYHGITKQDSISTLYIVPRNANNKITDTKANSAIAFKSRIAGKIIDVLQGKSIPPLNATTTANENNDFEFIEIQKQLNWFAEHYPRQSVAEDNNFPAARSGEIIIGDNSGFSPLDSNDENRAGIVYSVPYFGTNGTMQGIISIAFLSHLLQGLMIPGDYALHDINNSYVVPSPDLEKDFPNAAMQIAKSEFKHNRFYTESLVIHSHDASEIGLELIATAPDSEFLSRPLLVTLKRYEIGGYIIVATMMSGILGILYLLRNNLISERRSLLYSAQAAIEADQSKSDFLANMSHELRTPINSILGMTQLMMEGRLSADQREMLESVHYSSENLLEIVNDILDISKIEDAKLILEYIPFNVYEQSIRVINMLTPTANRKGLSLTLHNTDNSWPLVMGDPTRYGRILTNLVSNAIKYTENGTVDVHLSFALEDDDKVFVRLETVDTGIGIAEDKLDKIFEKFVQGDSSTTRKYGGSGLGLTITKELVEMMHGVITVDSTYGQGSRFCVFIPFKRATTTGKIATNQSLNAIPASQLRILVAEDHILNQTYLKKLLPSLGITQYSVVPNGLLAKEAVERGEVDIILMDCHMPVMNGYDASLAIRAAEQGTGRHIPIIAITADAMIAERDKCLECGMDEYLSKPISKASLIDVLSRWVLFEKHIPAITQSPIPPLPSLDLTVLQTFVEGNQTLEKEFAAIFFQQTNRHLAELKACCVDGTSDAWVETAHLLKGAAATLGAVNMRTFCEEAQNMHTTNIENRLAIFNAIQQEFDHVCIELKDIHLLD